MVYSQWKQRLFAFLLRRILGPYLSAESSRKLHDCVEVSIQDGMFALKDVTLSEEYLNSIVWSRADQDVSSRASCCPIIRQARIRKLIIQLSLEESGSIAASSRDSTTSSSMTRVAWKAMQLRKGTTSPSAPRVSLVAQIEVDGIELLVEPGIPTKTPGSREHCTITGQTNESSPKSSGGIMSSYVDAAMSSLRLSLQMRNFLLRFASLTPESPTRWVEIGLASAHYHDVEVSSSNDSAAAMGRLDDNNETVLHKAIDFGGISIHSGESPRESEGDEQTVPQQSSHVIGRTEGTGRITVRAIAYSDASSASKVCAGVALPTDGNTETTVHRVQQDVEVSLNQNFNMSFNEASLSHIGTIVKSFKVSSTGRNRFIKSQDAREEQTGDLTSQSQVALSRAPTSSLGNINEDEATDLEDIRAVSGMLKQFYEARQLAETNPLRGGILIPSSAFEDEGDSPIDDDQPVAFDTFFDANDQSFYHYKSVLEESVIESQAEDNAQADFIHTKVKLHLAGGGVKVYFSNKKCTDEKSDHDLSANRHPEEYALLTFNDIDVSSSVSAVKTELAMSISHVEMEDSVLKQSIGDGGEDGVEIGTVLRFTELASGDSTSSAVVSEAPCISLHFCSTLTKGSPKQCDIDFDLEAVDVIFRRYTFDNLFALVELYNTAAGISNMPVDRIAPSEPEKALLRFSCSCPSVNFSAPVCGREGDADGAVIVEKDSYENSFERCSYVLSNVPITPHANIGIVFESVSVTGSSGADQKVDNKGDDLEFSTTGCSSFWCDHVVLFVSFPTRNRGGSMSDMKRMDFLGLSGRAEVEPHVPVSIRCTSTSPTQNETSSMGEGIFPVVPSLSAFKARQEDEEKEIEDMYQSIYSSARMNELHDMEAAAGLRGTHPQESMLSEADKCTSVVEIHVPDIVGDMSRKEAVMLMQMFLATMRSTRKTSQVQFPDRSAESVSSGSRPWPGARIGVAFSCDQACLSAHAFSTDSKNSDVEGTKTSSTHSFMIMGDKWNAHALFDTAQLKSLRMLVHDISFFEVDRLVRPKEKSSYGLNLSVRDRCTALRDRNSRDRSTAAVPILYRSQLFSAMSPESPALLLDAVSQTAGTIAVENCSEWSVFFTGYNLTYRYNVDSAWLERLQGLLNGDKTPQKGEDCAASGERTVEQANSAKTRKKDSTSLTKLFLSLADCNLDYTSSKTFATASRTIVRLGDVRMSSNLVFPSGEIQAYRISVNDVSVHLTNSRSPYNSENSRLTRASALMRPEDLVSNLHSPLSAPETALQELHFITMATLDSMDVLLAVAEGKDPNEVHWDTTSRNEPFITASLSVGSFYLYACKDSFACLLDTINEWQLRITGLTSEQLEVLKTKSVPPSPCNKAAEQFFDTVSESMAEENQSDRSFAGSQERDLTRLEDMNVLSQPLTGVESEDSAMEFVHESVPSPINDFSQHSLRSSHEFLLDGYDWTTVDDEWTRNGEMMPGEEHSARWYSSASGRSPLSQRESLKNSSRERLGDDGVGKGSMEKFRIYPQHIPLKPTGDILSQGDMDAPKLAGTAVCPPVQARIMVRDLSLRCRFFDGYDWPKSARASPWKSGENQSFVIAPRNENMKEKSKAHVESEDSGDPDIFRESKRKSKLMGDLLEEQVLDEGEKTAFSNIPLPEEKSAMLKSLSETRRLARRSNRFFQMSVLGAKLRLDSFEESSAHQLASCMHLSIDDMFLAETLSSSKPVKMLGEWVNDLEHPRDTNDGLIMMKMASWQPEIRVSDDGEIVPMESRVALELLPLRCLLDQRAMRFVAAFFSGEDKEGDETPKDGHQKGNKKLWAVPPPSFETFKVKQSKLKVNYRPEKINVEALRDGSYVELVNLSPLNDMVITLQPITMHNLLGFGAVVKEMLHLWIVDVSSSQMYKFLTNAAPFQPISNVGGGVADFVVLPWEALRKGDKVATAVRSGARSLAGAVAFETLNTSSKLTQYAAEKLASLSSTTATSKSIAVSSMLPSRPQETPRGVPSTTGHAVESLAHGLSAASYKVVIIPVREYHRHGAVGAARSVVRGIPIAIMAPLSGATEALSYTLLGARNQLRPDIRKEEEASLRGLQHSDL